MKEMVYQIDSQGNLTGLWNDFLSDIDGNKEITRASNVEFAPENQGWIVTIEIGKYAGCCLPQLFKKRNKAIESEIEFFNEELSNEN